MNLGNRLLKLMKFRKMTQDELAHRADCSQATITKIINNKVSGSKFLIAIARELKCDANWLESGLGVNPLSIIKNDEKIPLFEAEQLKKFLLYKEYPVNVTFLRHKLDYENNNVIAMTIEDNSMTGFKSNPKPYIPGEIAIIDQEAIPFHGDTVVVINKDHVLLRQLINDGTNQMLVAANNDYPAIDYSHPENFIFCGVVISSFFENRR